MNKKTDSISLSKFIAQAGVCSRRKATELVQEGTVQVNGVTITEPGYKLQPNDKVSVNKKPVTTSHKKIYILLNKPVGYITTVSDERERKTVMDFFTDVAERIYPVGRLDKDTSGVLLLTNDGDLAQKLAHPRNQVEKTYHVTLDQPFASEAVTQIQRGVRLKDGIVPVDHVETGYDRTTVTLTIHSGKNRVIRRLFEKLGYRVTKLDRTQYAFLTHKGSRPGQWRYLAPAEVTRLAQL